VKETGKFLLEIQSQLLNLKIAVQDLKKEPATKKHLDTILEVLNQLGETSGIYGLNTILQYTGKITLVCKEYGKPDRTVSDDFFDFINDVEVVLNELVKDPMLTNKKLKAHYKEAVEKADFILNKFVSEESAKVSAGRFQEVFVDEAFDLINQLEEKMLQLESDPSEKTIIDEVFRIMHTLKGNSNMFGYKHLGEITHELENIYDVIRNKNEEISRPVLEITLQSIDHFRNLINDPELSTAAIKDQHVAMLSEIKSLIHTDTSSGSGEVVNKLKRNRETNTFYIFFKPQKDIFNDGTNPMYFVYDLHELGECLIIPAIDEQEMALEYDPEKCYTSWHIALVTDRSEEDIREHFLFLKDESKPSIKMLAPGNLLSDQNFRNHLKQKATNAADILDLDVNIHSSDEKKKQSQRVETAKDFHDSITSVRVASHKIDQMMNLISELVTKQAELSMLVVGHDNQRLTEVAESIENISRDLRDNAFSISLIPLEKSVLRFQRLVRDVSGRFGKKINFIIEGKETELDKTIIEKIVDPIMHILRNSIDHGIEKPAERIRKGKPETGTIILRAYPSGAHVIIEVSDDGAGINLEKVKETAVRKGMLGVNDQISRDDLLNLIISPGFSTAENISEVSGRGVGMDVVNQKISEIRGKLEITTEKDKGTTLTIELPLTISIIDCLLIKLGGEYFLVPLAVVERCAEVKAETVMKAENKYIVLEGQYIPFIDLRGEFSIQVERPAVQQVLLVRYKEMVVGLIVDEVIGNYQAVLKALGEAYKKQEIISGASILGSGEIALVLDTNRLIQEFAQRNEQKINAMA